MTHNEMSGRLKFEPMTRQEPGTIAFLLQESYRELLREKAWAGEREAHCRYDGEIFEHPDTVGACGFVSVLRGKLVGFASFDPRQGPESARVGHNCILPEFRGNGYGKVQILEVLRRLEGRCIRRAVVSTGTHPFFLAARKMYLSTGFRETRRLPGGPDPRYELIEYERDLFPEEREVAS